MALSVSEDALIGEIGVVGALFGQMAERFARLSEDIVSPGDQFRPEIGPSDLPFMNSSSSEGT
jgi:hypothetical protein